MFDKAIDKSNLNRTEMFSFARFHNRHEHEPISYLHAALDFWHVRCEQIPQSDERNIINLNGW